MDRRFEIQVVSGTPAQANRLTNELESAIRTVVQGIEIERRKSSAETQDFGTVLGIVATSAAAAAVGRGIGNWLAKRQSAKITISEGGKVIAENLTSNDAIRLAEVMSRKSNKK